MLASTFPARNQKAHITKNLHICQRFGAEGYEGGGGGGARKNWLYYISKVQTESFAFLAQIREAPVPEQTVPDSSPSTASCQDGTRISRRTGKGTGKKIVFYIIESGARL